MTKQMQLPNLGENSSECGWGCTETCIYNCQLEIESLKTHLDHDLVYSRLLG